MRKTLLSTGFASLALLTVMSVMPAPAVAGTEASWTATASSGSPDETAQGIYQFEGANATGKSGSPITGFTIRHAVTAVQGLVDAPNGYNLTWRFTDPTTSTSRITLRVIAVDLLTGATDVRLYSSSDWYPSSAGAQTRTERFCGVEPFDFSRQAVYLECNYWKSSSSSPWSTLHLVSISPCD